MPKQGPLDLYLDEVARVKATMAGTKETSYYPAVAMVLNAVGRELKPSVYCLHHPSGKDGIPDFGLFEQTKFKKGEQPTWKDGIIPERGAVEVKGAGHPIKTLLTSKQITEKYLPSYGLLLATNLWQWRLVTGQGVAETFDIGDDEKGFWKLVHGKRLDTLRTRFEDFLERCLLTAAPLTKPSDLAFFLASYARDALARLTDRADLPALAALRKGVEDAIGIQFDEGDGEHLFRSTLVQTLFYGLFSAWIVEVGQNKQPPFNWQSAQWSMTVPVARFLFEQVATPERLEPLEIVPLLDAAARALDRVDRKTFFAAFDDAQAIQFFYEPFLEFFDPDLRKELGVWYTPPEIVTYMVERVDRALRTELGLADGLADPNVWVLDPCCGTGSFVVAALERIRTTLESKSLGVLVAEEMKKAATTRIVGFEIMTAPLVIAHWQVGEALRRAGAALVKNERAAIYLTNALTGWAKSDDEPPIPGFEPLFEERGAAGTVKKTAPVLVVLGNPPYNAYAGTSPKSEGGLVDLYKVGLRATWGVKKFNLDELYVRFFRIAERRIADVSGKGVIAYISNFSWLERPSFVVMRQRLLQEFDVMWIDNLNGDSRETGKQTPDGHPDPSVFSTAMNREGIRVGTAVSMLVRKPGVHTTLGKVLFREFWGSEKRQELKATLSAPSLNANYVSLTPSSANRFQLRPGAAVADYASWAAIPELAAVSPLPGLLEKRGGALFDFDRGALEHRMRLYFDPDQSMEAVRSVAPGLATKMDLKDPETIRKRALHLKGERFETSRLVRFAIRPFDFGWAYIVATPGVWNRNRPELQHVLPDAHGLFCTRVQNVSKPEGFPAYWVEMLYHDRFIDEHGYGVPAIENLSGSPRPNLSVRSVDWLKTLGLAADADAAQSVWHHVLAITYSPAWCSENAAGIRQGWVRVPLPSKAEVLVGSANLGQTLSDLLNSEKPLVGITSGTIRSDLAAIATPSLVKGAAANWSVTAGWGNRSKKGVVMPSRGRLDTRTCAEGENEVQKNAAFFGEQTHDVWINTQMFWRNVPSSVWEFHIGGYQVLKKWLSYREETVLGRAITPDEFRHFTETARRLAALRLLGPTLDTNFRACAACHLSQTANNAMDASTSA